MKHKLSIFTLIIFFLFLQQKYFSQNFTWMRGSNTGTVASVFGTQGVSAPANTPGARHGCATWTDVSGNLWLFGGEGVLADEEWYNDLWKYSPATNQWTWMRGPSQANTPGTYGTQGVSSPANDPGPREFPMSWTDAAGNFWLFGGDGVTTSFNGPPVSKLADLWKYNPLTNEWTWMKGPNTLNAIGSYGTQNVAATGNFPGGRYWGATWTDNSGRLWLFGGRGFGTSAAGRLNDLWKYDPLTNNWAWVSGTGNIDPPGIFGTQSVPAALNCPGGRECPAAFMSPSGKLVLFGGQGYGNTSSIGLINDLWEFDISTGMWTWLNGSNTINPLGNYGNIGITATSNAPGGRASPACWTDPAGNYWLFGGEGRATASQIGVLNDLFKYNSVTNMWTWMKGDNTIDQTGIYGTQGTPAAANIPGGRLYNSWWKNTSTGNLWLFGGLGLTSISGPAESTNDLWKFTLPCNPDSVKSAVNIPICSGNSATLTAYNQFPSTVNWYTNALAGVTIGTGSILTTSTLSAQSTITTYTYYAESNSCTLTPRAMITITVLPLPQIMVTAPSSVCPNSTATLSATGGTATAWGFGGFTTTITMTVGTAPIVNVAVVTGSNGCPSMSVISIGVFDLPTIGAHSSRPTSCKSEPVTLTASGGSSYFWAGAGNGTSINVSPTVTTIYTVTGTDANGCSNTHTITQFVSNCTGIVDNVNSSQEIRVYPNPSTGLFYLDLPTDGTMVITTLSGALIQQIQLQNGINTVETNLPGGLYLYSVQTSDGNMHRGKLTIK